LIQSCKLLHLVGIQSTVTFYILLFSLSYSLPFVRHVSIVNGQEEEKLQTSTPSPYSTVSFTTAYSKSDTIHPVELFVYLIAAGLVTYFSRFIFLRNLLSLCLSTEVTTTQTNIASVAIYLLFMSANLFVFYRGAKFVRRSNFIASYSYKHFIFHIINCIEE